MEKSRLCDRHWRILGCVTDTREHWVLWQTLEKSGMCERHWGILSCVTDTGELKVVWQTGQSNGETCKNLLFHYRGTQQSVRSSAGLCLLICSSVCLLTFFHLIILSVHQMISFCLSGSFCYGKTWYFWWIGRGGGMNKREIQTDRWTDGQTHNYTHGPRRYLPRNANTKVNILDVFSYFFYI